MEVAGRREFRNLLSTTLMLHTKTEDGIYCHPCIQSDKRVTATDFCLNCREPLCMHCTAKHKGDSSTETHIMDRIDTVITAGVSAGVSSDSLPKCNTHQAEEVKLYCRAHETLGCVICMTLSHKMCEMDYIPEVSEKFLDSDEYLTFEKYTADFKDQCAMKIRNIEENILEAEETCSNIISQVKETKKEIIDALDKYEDEIEREVAEYIKENRERMESLKMKFESLVNEIVEIEHTANNLNKNKLFNSLFCKVKVAETKIQEYQTKSYELATSNSQECIFRKNPKQSSILTKEKLFGSISINSKSPGPCNASEILDDKPIAHINIKAEGDKKTCYASGLAFLSADQLAVADKANRNVKIVDVTFDKVISKIGLSSGPRDITVLPPDRLAVTLRDEKIIQLLSTKSGLSKLEQIKTDKKCRGIKYFDEKLIVAFDNLMSEIQIQDLEGRVLHKFQEDKAGYLLVHEPKSLALSPDHKHIYVADFLKNNVVLLSQSGTVTAVYKKSDFIGIAVSSCGTVYACAKDGGKVVQLSDDLSNAKVVLKETDGIKGPIALAFSRAKNVLYVSCSKGGEKACDKLHAFQLK